jgi:phosphoserine phosphatase
MNRVTVPCDGIKLRTIAIVPYILALLSLSAHAEDPLPSWNDTAPKKAIEAFVDRVTSPGSPDFVPVEERIATFDNDGTLWAEQPYYFEADFTFDRIKALAPQHPEWVSQEPFASVLKGDLESTLTLSNQEQMKMLLAAQAGTTSDEFSKIVGDWIATARHPQTGRLYTEMVYQPMVELLAYLRANGFKTFIVSGGGTDFMRPWAEKVYGIPPEQIVGTTLKTKFEIRGGKAVLVSQPALNFVDDMDGKPIGILSNIGRRPIAAFGNSDGDLQMMQWASAGSGPRLCLFVHHTDAAREWAYDRKSINGHFEKALDEALARGWTVVSMKDDWKVVCVSDKK